MIGYTVRYRLRTSYYAYCLRALHTRVVGYRTESIYGVGWAGTRVHWGWVQGHASGPPYYPLSARSMTKCVTPASEDTSVWLRVLVAILVLVQQ